MLILPTPAARMKMQCIIINIFLKRMAIDPSTSNRFVPPAYYVSLFENDDKSGRPLATKIKDGSWRQQNSKQADKNYLENEDVVTLYRRIARPLRSRIAFYYNTCASRHHQCVSIWRSIACEPASINFKKQKRVAGFWEVCNVFWLVYCNSRTHVVSGSLHACVQYSMWGLTIALYRGTIKLFSLYVIFLRIIPGTWLPLETVFCIVLTLSWQGRSKRSGWSGHGRTNNRAGNLFIFIYLLFF